MQTPRRLRNSVRVRRDCGPKILTHHAIARATWRVSTRYVSMTTGGSLFRWIDAGPEDAETMDRHEPGRVFIDRGDSAHARWASAMARQDRESGHCRKSENGQSRRLIKSASYFRSTVNFGHVAALRQLTRWAKAQSRCAPARCAGQEPRGR